MRHWSRLVQVTHSIPKKLKPCVNTSLLMERYKNNEKTCTSSNHALQSKVLFSTRLPLHLKWGNKNILMCVHKLVSCTHYVFILVCRHSMSKPIRLQCIMFCAWEVSHNFLKKLSHQETENVTALKKTNMQIPIQCYHSLSNLSNYISRQTNTKH